MSKASLVLGIIGLVLAVLPFLSAWFIFLSWLVWIIALVGLVLGIVALVKKQDKALVGTILNVAALVLVWFAGRHAVNAAAESIATSETATEWANQLQESLDNITVDETEAPADSL